MRWPCGPLDIERGRRREGFTSREADTLQQWSDPQALELLAGTPVNGLVVTWAEGSPADETQQPGPSSPPRRRALPGARGRRLGRGHGRSPAGGGRRSGRGNRGDRHGLPGTAVRASRPPLRKAQLQRPGPVGLRR